MDDFVFLGTFQLRERARRIEQLSRDAWKKEGNDPAMQPRRRFPRLRGR